MHYPAKPIKAVADNSCIFMVSGPLTDEWYDFIQRRIGANRPCKLSDSPMLIACPNCQTSYQLADVAIGPNGRSVRCSRCQNQWRAMSPSANNGTLDQSKT